MESPRPQGTNEIELKRLLLGPRAAERLLDALGAPVIADVVQTNHVYDTPDRRLRGAHLALRLRTVGASAFLTAKGPARAVGASTSSKAEAEVSIEPALGEAILGGSRDPLAVLRERIQDARFDELWREFDAVLAGATVSHRGSFENRRRTVQVGLDVGLDLEVEVDRTTFPGGRVDQEVEIELPDDESAPAVEAWLEGLARRAGIETWRSSPKLVRFYAALEAASR